MKKKPKIAVLFDISRGSERQILQGVIKYSKLKGFWSFYTPTVNYSSANGLNERWKDFKSDDIDGFLVSRTEFMDKILSKGKPVVYVGVSKQDYDLPVILSDGEKIGKMAAEHFLEKKYVNFAFCGFEQISWSQQRSRSFRDAVVEKGFDYYDYTEAKKNSKNKGYSFADWIHELPKPLGLFACNDDRARQLANVIADEGFDIPRDIAVLGVDNDEFICELSNPPLSSIALNFEQGGYRAGKILQEMITGRQITEEEAKILVKPVFIEIRRSSDIFSIEDKEVLDALSFIRDNSYKVISVSDVVQEVGSSRRRFEAKFRKIIGHSIYDEIRKVKVEQICKYLVQTDWPIANIAMKLGHSSIDHFSRFFKREMDMSPSAYRKKCIEQL